MSCYIEITAPDINHDARIDIHTYTFYTIAFKCEYQNSCSMSEIIIFSKIISMQWWVSRLIAQLEFLDFNHLDYRICHHWLLFFDRNDIFSPKVWSFSNRIILFESPKWTANQQADEEISLSTKQCMNLFCYWKNLKITKNHVKSKMNTLYLFYSTLQRHIGAHLTHRSLEKIYIFAFTSQNCCTHFQICSDHNLKRNFVIWYKKFSD